MDSLNEYPFPNFHFDLFNCLIENGDQTYSAKADRTQDLTLIPATLFQIPSASVVHILSYPEIYFGPESLKPMGILSTWGTIAFFLFYALAYKCSQKTG